MLSKHANAAPQVHDPEMIVALVDLCKSDKLLVVSYLSPPNFHDDLLFFYHDGQHKIYIDDHCL